MSQGQKSTLAKTVVIYKRQRINKESILLSSDFTLIILELEFSSGMAAKPSKSLRSHFIQNIDL